MSRNLTAEAQAALLETAMRVDVSQYSPLETFIEANDRAPTVSELATYIADIRVTEAVAIANRIAKVQEDDENQSA